MTIEHIISHIIAKLTNTSGDEFFNTLTLQLHEVIGADYTFIARIDEERHISTTISLVVNGSIAENIEYSLKNTPCDDVYDDSTCIYPKEICRLYPKDQLLVDMQVEGYLGSPLHNSKGQVMGLVVALYKSEIVDPSLTKSLFELFSGRISAEIEREEHAQQLQALNDNLESEVEKRTKELTETLENLKATQEHMMAQERLASLGSLVAGVAHEINTPIGVAMLSSTNISDISDRLNNKLEKQVLSKNDLTSALDDIAESSESLQHNLRRAADLITNFKQVAVERNLTDYTHVNLNKWLDTQLSSLRPLMKQNGVKLNAQIDDEVINLKTYPSKLSQVLVNIAQNAAVHGFDGEHSDNKELSIHLTQNKDNVFVSIKDNGKGIPTDIKNKIFDPFFTTKRNSGGTGLGLSIVHSIVTGTLDGTIDVNSSEGVGTEFVLTLPKG